MISIIVCTYNRSKYIFECLFRIASNKTDEPFELIVVNNNSTDCTLNEIQRFEREACIFENTNILYKYVLETKQGLSHARNRGMSEAQGDWFCFLDDDAFVEDDYIKNIICLLRQYPNIGAFGGKIVPVFESEMPQWLNPWSLSFVSGLDLGKRVVPFTKNKYPIGANMGISRKVIEVCGMFNTELGRDGSKILLGGEEKDLFIRIISHGYSLIYSPDISVHHVIPHQRTSIDYIKRLGLGVGISERIRTTAKSNKTYYFRLFVELIKWGGTLILWLHYALKRETAKGNVLIIFRYNVTKGLIQQIQK